MDTINRKLQAILDGQIGRGNIYNVVVAVQSHDRSLDFVGAAGIADPQTRAAMTSDTPYFIASVTKMFTAAIILKLYEKNRLDINAPIAEYLPAELIRGIHVYKGTDYSEKITISNLISQNSGLADYETDRPRGGKSVLDGLKAGYDRGVSTPEAMEIIRGMSAHFAPGTPGKAYYSNCNYRLLGVIIEAITGKSMAVNFQEMICVPLGLRQTYLFDCTAPRQGATPATIYFKNAPANIPKYISSNVSDGGLVSTASECMVFLRAFFEGRLFDKSLFERMMNWNSIFFPLQYGYGLMYFQLPRFFWPTPLPEFIGHSGTTGSFAFTCPSRALYIVGTLDQVSPAKPYFLMMELVRAAGGIK